MDIAPRHRRALSTALALVLAVESVSAVAAVADSTGALRVDPGQPTPAAAVRSLPSPAAQAPLVVLVRTTRHAVADAGVGSQAVVRVTTVVKSSRPDAPKREARTARPHVPKKSSSGAASPATFSGRNHVWIPALHITRSVARFACTRSRPPDNFVYRWGCAGHNNVYLLGHAYSVFKSVHDAYVGGRLHKGLKAYYADAAGKVHVYAVKWWRLTAPTTAAKWAWAAQSAPSMTIQTCVGKHSEYRLMIRLVEVGG